MLVKATMRLLLAKLGVLTSALLCISGAFAQNSEAPTDPTRSALRAQDFDKAIDLTRSALRTSPNNARLWTLQGIAFAGKGENSGSGYAPEANKSQSVALTLIPYYAWANRAATPMQVWTPVLKG